MNKPELTPQANEVNIIDELNKATENPSPETDFVQEEILKDPALDNADFEQPKAQDPAPGPIPQPEPQKVVNPLDFKKSANRYVNLLSDFLKLCMPSLLKKSILKPGDAALLTKHKREKDLNPQYNIQDAVSSDDKLYYALIRFEELEKEIARVELTKDEKEAISEPLAEVLAKHQHLTLSPEGALVMAVFMVMMPRLTPFVSQKVMNMFK